MGQSCTGGDHNTAATHGQKKSFGSGHVQRSGSTLERHRPNPLHIGPAAEEQSVSTFDPSSPPPVVDDNRDKPDGNDTAALMDADQLEEEDLPDLSSYDDDSPRGSPTNASEAHTTGMIREPSSPPVLGTVGRQMTFTMAMVQPEDKFSAEDEWMYRPTDDRPAEPDTPRTREQKEVKRIAQAHGVSEPLALLQLRNAQAAKKKATSEKETENQGTEASSSTSASETTDPQALFTPEWRKKLGFDGGEMAQHRGLSFLRNVDEIDEGRFIKKVDAAQLEAEAQQREKNARERLRILVDELSNRPWSPSTTSSSDASSFPSVPSTPSMVVSPSLPSTPLPTPKRQKAPKDLNLPPFVKDVEVQILGLFPDRVKSISISADEKELCACSRDDRTLQFFSIPSCNYVGRCKGHEARILQCEIGPQLEKVATCGLDRTLKLWDRMKRVSIRTLPHRQAVVCCGFSPDAKYIVTGCQDRVCRVWALSGRWAGECVLVYTGHRDTVVNVVYSPDGYHIASAAMDKTIQIWSSQTGKVERIIQAHTSLSLCLYYTPDGRKIVSCGSHEVLIFSTRGDVLHCIEAQQVVPISDRATNGVQPSWGFCSTVPGVLSNTHLVLSSVNCAGQHPNGGTQRVYLYNIIKQEIVWSYYPRASVFSISPGRKDYIGFGDAKGNVYLLKLTVSQ